MRQITDQRAEHRSLICDMLADLRSLGRSQISVQITDYWSVICPLISDQRADRPSIRSSRHRHRMMIPAKGHSGRLKPWDLTTRDLNNRSGWKRRSWQRWTNGRVENARLDNPGTNSRGRKRETQSRRWKTHDQTTWDQICRTGKDIRLIILLTQNSEEKDRYFYF